MPMYLEVKPGSEQSNEIAMYQQQEWFFRQIEMMVQFIARVLFHQEAIVYEIQDEMQPTQTDELYNRIMFLLAQGELGRAEDLLFAQLDPSDTRTA